MAWSTLRSFCSTCKGVQFLLLSHRSPFISSPLQRNVRNLRITNDGPYNQHPTSANIAFNYRSSIRSVNGIRSSPKNSTTKSHSVICLHFCSTRTYLLTNHNVQFFVFDSGQSSSWIFVLLVELHRFNCCWPRSWVRWVSFAAKRFYFVCSGIWDECAFWAVI